ncbi:MAG: DMT family transporter [Anaerolineales bacterium]|nr:DMT family transporter [Anaerolineales bacterium]
MDQSDTTNGTPQPSIIFASTQRNGGDGDQARLTGAGLCTVSAAGFASLSILGKLALNADLSIVTILSLRFTGAAALLAVYLALFRRRKLFFDARQVVVLILLGAVGYAGQSALYFAALERNSASLNSLLLYVYPGFVALFNWFLNQRTLSNREWVALALASSGVILTLNPIRILQSAGGEPIDLLGVTLVIGSAIWYAAYIISSDRFTRRAGPWVSLVWISLGAAISFTAAGAFSHSLDFDLGLKGILILLGMVTLSTILALGTFLAGLQRVGPTTASLLSTLEPVFTVLLAILFLGEILTTIQTVGGGLVLAAAGLLSASRRHPPQSD